MGKQFNVRSHRSVRDIATIVKRTGDDPSSLSLSLRAGRALGGSETRWESVPTDSYDHFAFGVMDTEPDWSVRYLWEARQNPAWWCVDFVVFDHGDYRDVTAAVEGTALSGKGVANKLAKRVIDQL